MIVVVKHTYKRFKIVDADRFGNVEGVIMGINFGAKVFHKLLSFLTNDVIIGI